MKVKVQLYNSGKVFYEIVYARDYEEAKKTAQVRNPSSKIISANAVFD
jgi:hypothetical protein